jgi:hypothetical protein
MPNPEPICTCGHALSMHEENLLGSVCRGRILSENLPEWIDKGKPCGCQEVTEIQSLKDLEVQGA